MELNWRDLTTNMDSKIEKARNDAMEAIANAKIGNFDKAHERMNFSNIAIDEAKDIYSDIMQFESRGNTLPYKVIFVNSTSLLATVEGLILMAQEIINVYKKIPQK